MSICCAQHFSVRPVVTLYLCFVSNILKIHKAIRRIVFPVIFYFIRRLKVEHSFPITIHIAVKPFVGCVFTL